MSTVPYISPTIAVPLPTVAVPLPTVAVPLPTVYVNSVSPTKEIVSATERYVSYQLTPDRWFPMIEGLSHGNVQEATNEKSSWGSAERLAMFYEMGRITSYERFYSHPDGCNSNDLKGVYIQVFFFQSSDGAKSFFDWANKDAVVQFTDIVGDHAYIYTETKDENDGCKADIVSTSFQRYNVIGRARVRGVEGKMDYATMEALSLDIALFIDSQIMSNAE